MCIRQNVYSTLCLFDIRLIQHYLNSTLYFFDIILIRHYLNSTFNPPQTELRRVIEELPSDLKIIQLKSSNFELTLFGVWVNCSKLFCSKGNLLFYFGHYFAFGTKQSLLERENADISADRVLSENSVSLINFNFGNL